MKHVRPSFPTAIRVTLEAPAPATATVAPMEWLLARVRLPRQSPLSWAMVFFIAVLLVAVLLDQPVRAYALSLDPTLRVILRALTAPGNAAWPLGIGIIGLAGLRSILRQERRRDAIALARLKGCILFLMGSVALSGAMASLSKNIIGRARPMTPSNGTFDLSLLAFDPAWASFPSGHATTATAMMVCLALIWPRHGLGFVTLGLLMALTRCLLGAHWMSDVIAGAALGALVTLALRRQIDGRRRRALLSPAMERLCIRAAQRAAQGAMVRIARWAAEQRWPAIRLPGRQ